MRSSQIGIETKNWFDLEVQMSQFLSFISSQLKENALLICLIGFIPRSCCVMKKFRRSFFTFWHFFQFVFWINHYQTNTIELSFCDKTFKKVAIYFQKVPWNKLSGRKEFIKTCSSTRDSGFWLSESLDSISFCLLAEERIQNKWDGQY